MIDRRGVGDGIVAELVLRHEHQHNETMLQTLQLAQLDGYELPRRDMASATSDRALTGLELVEVPGGPVHDRRSGGRLRL